MRRNEGLSTCLCNTDLTESVCIIVHTRITQQFDIHLDHKRIDCVIRDCGIPDVNDTLVKGSRVADKDLEALMVNWNLWSLMIRLHGECQFCAFIN